MKTNSKDPGSASAQELAEYWRLPSARAARELARKVGIPHVGGRYPWHSIWQAEGLVSLAARRELDRADIARACVHGDMDLAPLPAARRTMLENLPLAVAAEFDAGAIDQEVQRLPGCTIRDLHRDPRLPSAERRMIRHRPIELGHPDQALDQPGRLAKRKTQETFQRQASLDRARRENGPPDCFLILLSREGLGPPRLPDFSACQTMLGSNHTDSEPRLRSEAL